MIIKQSELDSFFTLKDIHRKCELGISRPKEDFIKYISRNKILWEMLYKCGRAEVLFWRRLRKFCYKSESLKYSIREHIIHRIYDKYKARGERPNLSLFSFMEILNLALKFLAKLQITSIIFILFYITRPMFYTL